MRKILSLTFCALALQGCMTPSARVAPELYIPEEATATVHTHPKPMSLEPTSMKELKSHLSVDNRRVIDSLVYNYYDNFFHLQMCNNKLIDLNTYLAFYENSIMTI